MANAQKEIEERKRALTAMKEPKPGVNAAAAAAQHLKVLVQQNNAIPPPSVIKPVLYSRPGEYVTSLIHGDMTDRLSLHAIFRSSTRSICHTNFYTPYTTDFCG